MRRHRKIRGFTLIELAMGMAVMTVTAALVLPAMQESRESARRTQCRNNLHLLALALHNYESAYRMFPCGWTSNNKLSWHVRILPFVEQQNLYNEFNYQVPFDPQSRFVKTQIAGYRCPSDRGPPLANNLGRSNYAGVMVGKPSNTKGESTHGGGAFGLNSFHRFGDFTDGMSNSLMVGERRSTARPPRQDQGKAAAPAELPKGGTEGTWVGLNPGELSIVSSSELGGPNSTEYGAFSSPHRGGVFFAFADGSVHFVSENINLKTFAAVCTINGNEAVNVDF